MGDLHHTSCHNTSDGSILGHPSSRDLFSRTVRQYVAGFTLIHVFQLRLTLRSWHLIPGPLDGNGTFLDTWLSFRHSSIVTTGVRMNPNLGCARTRLECSSTSWGPKMLER